MANNKLEAKMRATIPVADNMKKNAFATAIPRMTHKELLNPFDADSAVTAITAGPGESTTTKVVTKKSSNVCIGIKAINLQIY